MTEVQADKSNVETDGLWVLVFYVVSSILLIGTLFQIILSLPAGEKFYILVIKKFKVLHVITYILQLLSMVYFPVMAFYVFIVLYVNKSKTLF